MPVRIGKLLRGGLEPIAKRLAIGEPLEAYFDPILQEHRKLLRDLVLELQRAWPVMSVCPAGGGGDGDLRLPRGLFKKRWMAAAGRLNAKTVR